jgi:DNA polymerase
MYLRAAEDIGQKGKRQLGKVIELSMGYGGGVGAFRAMGRNYGISLPVYEIEAHKNAWRRANSWAQKFWTRLEKQAKWAINNPGKKAKVSRGITYLFAPELMGGTLLCELPDGTLLSYPQARIEDQQITAMKAAYGMRQDATEWPRYKLWGGLLAENVTQAFCAALLRNVLSQISAVMHIHDEVVLEVPSVEAKQCAAQLQSIMETPPSWAAGLPLEAVPKILTRYGKG